MKIAFVPLTFRYTPSGGLAVAVAIGCWITAMSLCLGREPKPAAVVALAGIASTLYGWSSFVSPPFAERTLLTSLPLLAAAIASYVRQCAFEVSSVGHLTGRMDSCAVALAPLTIGFYFFVPMVVALVLSAFGMVLDASPSRAHDTDAMRRRDRSFLALLAILVIAGAVGGEHSWKDWQIDQPCL